MNILRLTPWNWLTKDVREQNPALEAQRQASPFALHREIDRLFDDTFRTMGHGISKTAEGVFSPRVDIAASPAEYTVTAELPGIDEKDITLELKDDVLLLKAEKKQESKEENEGYYRVERQYGLFQRALHLPEDADIDKITAKNKNGILTIVIPRREPQDTTARRIEITS